MFTFKPLSALPDVVRIEFTRDGDPRGWFAEVYKQSVFAANGIVAEFRQENHSRSPEKGTLRGLHYQAAPFAQGKLIRVISGEIFDVAVDIREGSPTFRRWASTVLSAWSCRSRPKLAEFTLESVSTDSVRFWPVRATSFL